MIDNRVRQLYATLVKTPFPLLAKNNDDIVLYDSAVAGMATKCLAAKPTGAKPRLFGETSQWIRSIDGKHVKTHAEHELLNYLRLLDDLLDSIGNCSVSDKGK